LIFTEIYIYIIQTRQPTRGSTLSAAASVSGIKKVALKGTTAKAMTRDDATQPADLGDDAYDDAVESIFPIMAAVASEAVSSARERELETTNCELR
jgi:hypothetical protein